MVLVIVAVVVAAGRVVVIVVVRVVVRVIVIVIVFREEVRIDFELRVQVEAAQVEDFLDVGVAEIHDLDRRARVHVHRRCFRSSSAAASTEIGLRDEQAIRETDLALHHFVLVELMIARASRRRA